MRRKGLKITYYYLIRKYVGLMWKVRNSWWKYSQNGLFHEDIGWLQLIDLYLNFWAQNLFFTSTSFFFFLNLLKCFKVESLLRESCLRVSLYHENYRFSGSDWLSFSLNKQLLIFPLLLILEKVIQLLFLIKTPLPHVLLIFNFCEIIAKLIIAVTW